MPYTGEMGLLFAHHFGGTCRELDSISRYDMSGHHLHSFQKIISTCLQANRIAAHVESVKAATSDRCGLRSALMSPLSRGLRAKPSLRPACHAQDCAQRM